ncbi:(d)CMP kinase [Candidatus Chlorohelix sp.]|uniref:(d)CMP kinase n=1 Tax=Candidatus Chlorohelix sp. TaxID=3139201 RepID=UPI003068555C
MKRRLQIAIDGTAGVGKTTIGQMLANMLACPYLDTGAMYRAVALLTLRTGTNPSNIAELERLSQNLNFEARDVTPQEAVDGRQYTVLVDGEDVSQAIRDPQVESIVSQIAAISEVRVALVQKQREMAERAGTIIMIGRDIASVVLPNAELKIFLDASPEVRAMRRNRQAGSGEEQARQNLEQRDKLDSQRAVSPLVVAPGAIVIDTDNLNPQQVLERIKAEIAKILD